MRFSSTSRGFSIAEVIVVIAVIATLSALAYSSFSTNRARSRDQQRVSDLNYVALALEQYLNANGTYPSVLSTLVPGYMAAVPVPPTTPSGNAYQYHYVPLAADSAGSHNCTSYQLWTTFELSNSYVNAKAGFDSKSGEVSRGYFCYSPASTDQIDASNTPLVYDVVPK